MPALQLTIHQARGSRLEELETCELTLVVDCIAPILWVFKDFLNDIRHCFGSISRFQILQLPLLVSNGQEQYLCSRLRVIHCRLHYVALAIIWSHLLASEELHCVFQAFHVRCLRAAKPRLDQHLVEGVLVVELITCDTIECEDTHMRRKLLAEVCIARAFNRSSAWNDQVNVLLSYNGLHFLHPFLGLHGRPGKDIVLGDISAESCVAELVRHDFSGEDFVAITANCSGNCRCL